MVKDKISFVLAWATYIFLFYTLSFNALRQSIALSFILLSITYAFKKRFVNSFAMILLASLFHVSAVIALLSLILGLSLLKHNKKWVKTLLLFAYMVIVLILPTVAKLLNNSGFFSEKYSNYFLQYVQYSVLSAVLMRVPILLLVLASLILFRSKLPLDVLFLYIITITEFCLLPLQSISTAVGRIILYFGICKVVSYPIVINYLKLDNKIIRCIAYIGLLTLLAGIFYGQIIINNNGLVYPYTVSTDIL